MTFKFHCACGQKVSASDDMIGTTAVCPRCGSKVAVPRPSQIAPLPPPPSETSPSPSQSPAPPAPPEPAVAESPAPSSKPAEAPTISPAPPSAPATPVVPPAPMTIAPRPLGRLWMMALLAGAAMLGTGGYFFRHLLTALPKNLLPFIVGAIVGVVVAAILLRLIVRLIARFDFAFLEALLATIFATTLVALATMPIALSRLGVMPPEQAARLLPVTGAVGLLLILVGYAFAIHTAKGRRIGIGRGIIVFLLQFVSVALLIGAVVELVKRLG